MAADSARQRTDRNPPSNLGPSSKRAIKTSYSQAIPRWANREGRFASILVDLGSCAGAYVSALAKLQSVQSDHAFTIFAKSVRDVSVWPEELAPDPSCAAK